MKKRKHKFDSLYGIIWYYDKPTLWINFETYTHARVINGGWDLCDLDTEKKTFSIIGPNGKVMKTDVAYTKLTYAGENTGDYNEVLYNAKTGNLVELDLGMHNLAKNFDELYEKGDEDDGEIPF